MFKKILKNIFPFLVTVFIPYKVFAGDLDPVVIRDFSCGMVTSVDPTMIGNGCSPEAWNMDVWTGRLQKRRGSLLQNSSPLTGNQAVRFMKEFPDGSGNKWLITASSNSLFKSNNSGGINSVLTSSYGITATSDFQGVNAYGKVRLVDGSTNSILFDGNTVSISTATPKGTLIAFMFERVWEANVSGDNSTLYASRLGDPEDWTDDGLADNDAMQIPVRKNDGYPIRALIPYGNVLLIFKDRSIDALTMDNSGLVPIITAISNNIGTQHPKSIQVRYNDVIFMGPDGFYSLQAGQLANISNNIKPTFDSILQKNSVSRSFTETTQTDFSGGTAQGLSASISPGGLVLSTAQFVDNTTSQFVQGQLEANLSTTAVSGSIVLSGAFEDFLDGNYNSNPTWLLYGGTPTVANNRVTWTSGPLGSFIISTVAVVPGEVVFFDQQSAGGYLVGGRVILSTYPVTSADMALSVFSGNTIAWDIYGDVSPDGSGFIYVGTMTSVVFPQGAMQSRYSMSLFASSVNFRNDSGNIGTITNNLASVYTFLAVGISNRSGSQLPTDSLPVSFSNIFIATGQISTAGDFATYVPVSSTFVSRNFPLSANGLWYGSATFNATLNSSIVTYSVYGDSNTAISITNNNTWISSASVYQGIGNTATGTFSLSGSSTVFYSANLTRSATAAAFALIYPKFSSSQLDFRCSSGTYLGQNISLQNISAFGVFNEAHNSGGTIGFNIYSDTDSSLTPSDPTSFIASQTITNNNVPSISTASFGRILYSASITDYFQNPQLLDYTVTWLQGSANFPVASLFYEGDYIICVSTRSTSYNDTCLIYDRNDHWSPPYTGLNLYSLALYNQQAFAGSATAGSIYRIQVDNTYSDNGVAIDSFWKSKEFDFNSPLTKKTMRRFYITAQRNSGKTLTFNYGIDRGATTSRSLDLGLTPGFYREVFGPSSLTYGSGVQHSFSFRNNVLDANFDLLSVTLWPRLEVDPGPN